MFKSATADVYVVFGESSNEDASQNQFTTGANQLAQAEQQERLASESRQKSADKAAVTAESNDDGDVDETGLEPSEIEMVMDQVSSPLEEGQRLKSGQDKGTGAQELEGETLGTCEVQTC